ncbi:hypothetical protein V6N13_095618 [Hibiscus sabdariffa]|uniref:Uncharacterized protein n=1 Tax=Hibiscus sabdariffa TaxID=183260 RepID=A0ABR2B6L4_9ROSI
MALTSSPFSISSRHIRHSPPSSPSILLPCILTIAGSMVSANIRLSSIAISHWTSMNVVSKSQLVSRALDMASSAFMASHISTLLFCTKDFTFYKSKLFEQNKGNNNFKNQNYSLLGLTII